MGNKSSTPETPPVQQYVQPQTQQEPQQEDNPIEDATAIGEILGSKDMVSAAMKKPKLMSKAWNMIFGKPKTTSQFGRRRHKKIKRRSRKTKHVKSKTRSQRKKRRSYK